MLIINEPIVNKSKEGTDLLIEYLLPAPKKPLYLQTGKPNPRNWSYKNIIKKEPIVKPLKKSKIGKKICIEDFATKENSNIDELT